MSSFKTLKDLKKAIDQGKKVKWANSLYDCIKDDIGQYLIICSANDHTVGLEAGVGERGGLGQFYVYKGV